MNEICDAYTTKEAAEKAREKILRENGNSIMSPAIYILKSNLHD